MKAVRWLALAVVMVAVATSARAEKRFEDAVKSVTVRLEPSEAADLCCWYLRRLAERIAPAERDQPTDVPTDTESAVARFLFAHMSDLDLRLRWKAAHAVRRLARNGEHGTLAKLVSLYYRTEEQAFRGKGLPFYWIAARLWLVIALDRIAQEAPAAIAPRLRSMSFCWSAEGFPPTQIVLVKSLR